MHKLSEYRLTKLVFKNKLYLWLINCGSCIFVPAYFHFVVPFLRSSSKNSLHFMELDVSLPCPQDTVSDMTQMNPRTRFLL
jgi:hypothetical protein